MTPTKKHGRGNLNVAGSSSLKEDGRWGGEKWARLEDDYEKKDRKCIEFNCQKEEAGNARGVANRWKSK